MDINDQLIKEDQRMYQDDMKEKYGQLKTQLTKYIGEEVCHSINQLSIFNQLLGLYRKSRIITDMLLKYTLVGQNSEVTECKCKFFQKLVGSVVRSVCQVVRQSVCQSVRMSISQSVGRSVIRSVLYWQHFLFLHYFLIIFKPF